MSDKTDPVKRNDDRQDPPHPQPLSPQGRGVAGEGDPSPGLLGEQFVALLARAGVGAEELDPQTLRLKAVPVSPQFTKPRTNLLLRRTAPAGRSTVYLDSDLAYHGPDPAVRTALTGPCHGHWRQLCISPVPGAPTAALASVLDLLGSPLAGPVRAALGQQPPGRGAAQHPEVGRLLTASGQFLEADSAEQAYSASFRQDLAEQLAILTTRLTPPHAAVLCGPSGCGRDHLMVAAAHVLLDSGRSTDAFCVSAARVAAGCIFPAEVDGALMRLLDEMVPVAGVLFLIEDLDLLVTGSPVGLSLLTGALDRGLRFLATLRNDAALHWLGDDDALRRRLAFVNVEPPPLEEVAAALRRFAEESNVPVAPTTIQTVLHLAAKQDAAEPAAALSLLGAALAEAAWHGSPQVGPDNVFAVRHLINSTNSGKEHDHA
jgi:hypothetical protein